MLHKNIPASDNHGVYTWAVANSTARTVLSVSASDVGKMAWQQDNDTFWVLKAHDPMDWVEVASVAAHNHDGTYEPADATILKDADIGVNVAAYSHPHPTKKDRTGFPVDSNGAYLTTLTYNETTRTVTVSPTGADFKVYAGGVEYTKTAQSLAHAATQGGHFIYYDDTGTLVTGTTPWDLLKHAPVAYVFWDATNSRGICFEERHHADRDVWWHRNQHAAEGTKATSGFGVSGYTLNDGSTDTAVTFAVATGRVEDEDIRVDTQSLPDNGPYTILYRSGASGDWVVDRASVRPFKDSGTALQYNQWTGATWQLTALTEDYYVNYYVFGTTSLPTTDYTPSPTTTQQIIIVPGQTIYSSEAAAHAESVGNLSWGTVPLQEIVPLYQVTMRYNASNPAAFANTAKCAISRMQRVIGTSVSITQATQSDHGALAGLADDDHPQYHNDARGDLRYELIQTAASQAEMEAGTEAGIRSMSPLRVAQAISALSGGPGGNGKVTWSVSQASHGLSVGNAIYHTGTGWAKALSDASSTVGIAIVSAVADTDNFTAQQAGEITGLSGLTAGLYYYVSGATPGVLTSSEPGSGYSNPILFSTSTTAGVVLPYRPSAIGVSAGSGAGLEAMFMLMGG